MDSNLWGFLASWRSLFDKFDEDGSGNISYEEFFKALVGRCFVKYTARIRCDDGRLKCFVLAFGYRLTPPFVQLLFRTYDKRGMSLILISLIPCL